jgi:transposase-like protein
MTVNGMNMCAEHAGAAAIDPGPDVMTSEVETENKERGEMAHDKEQMQRDRDAGMSAAEVAKKHDCNIHVVYLYTRKNGAKPRRAVGRPEAIATRAERPKASNGDAASGSCIPRILSQLKEERDRLDRAIASLEQIYA